MDGAHCGGSKSGGTDTSRDPGNARRAGFRGPIETRPRVPPSVPASSRRAGPGCFSPTPAGPRLANAKSHDRTRPDFAECLRSHERRGRLAVAPCTARSEDASRDERSAHARFGRATRMTMARSFQEIAFSCLTAAERATGAVYVLDEPLGPGTLRLPGVVIDVAAASRLAFVDREPAANWGHS